MKFIDQAAQLIRHYAMQAMVAAITLQGVWMKLPDDLKASIPHEWVSGFTIVLLVLGMVGHVYQVMQPPQDKP